MAEYLIYALVDPRDQQVRYIGKSSRGLLRPRQHWTHRAIRETRDHCHNWVRSVLHSGLIPEILVLQECVDIDELNEAYRDLKKRKQKSQ